MNSAKQRWKKKYRYGECVFIDGSKKIENMHLSNEHYKQC